MGGPFALSVPGYKLGVHTRRHRKLDGERRASQSPSPSPARSLPEDAASSYLPSGSINPLSHTPDTLRQFAVAGLSPEDELPSRLYPSFPHRPLPPEYPSRSRRNPRRTSMPGTSTGESEVESGSRKEAAAVQQHSARLKHLNTMTAIMHRCLHEGDIARAKRAFGLLVQTKEIDVRLNNLWAIGSEILMRAPEAARGDDDSPLPRWGSAANVSKVKEYLSSLIQQHPHDPHRPQLTSAVDFWPALFGIEVYDINAELQRALYHLDTRDEDDNDEEMDDDPDDDRRQQLGALWAAKDEVRRQTQAAARQLAARMDRVMESAPYAAHPELLRLRAHVSLFIADLHLPARVVEAGDAAAAAIVERMGVLSLRGEGEALEHRKEEQRKARAFFQRILDNGGELVGGGWIREFMDEDEDEDEEDQE
ncbi:hypothetical protein F4775DRAFT_272865 [Biscogniauxia sp. FL1348]|nr:hypothetical protein F4775DRAFT_272865 [Biscogniauxia sp. FL1348]